MPRLAPGFVPPVAIDARRRTPIYRQLYEWFQSAILAGHLRPGQRVPSTRQLATELGVSRIPVLGAYEQLHAEGYLESFVGAGTCVARSIPERVSLIKRPAVRRAERAPNGGGPRRTSRLAGTIFQTDQSWLGNPGAFRISLPALDQFPAAVWARLVNRHTRRVTRAMMAYGDPMGDRSLREAIAEYVGAARAARCDPSQILVTTGSQQGLLVTARVLFDAHDAVWVEDPGYPGARQALLAAGARMVPVPVDAEGLDVARGARAAPSARAVYITPSHQHPLGVTMSATRRMTLLDWASRAGAWIIEDDYDSEYRFDSRPIASLHSMDADARVIYVGTFSKVLFPALRLGYVVVPKDLVPAFSAMRDASDVFSSTLYQAVVNDFIREGHFARHIRRMRMVYMERRQALVDAIRAEAGDWLDVVGAAAGLHLAALLPPGVSDQAVAKRAAAKGILVTPLSSCYFTPPARGGLILGYGGIAPHEIREGVRTLASCLVERV
ncbi:MAG TPA: PLP-dependent aminotransferase family protein [Gemmatimonadaceae bacterium]|nr:PLP-dependent aminotransferase family protein [Gemmatimonadaceae bacterium]